MYKLLKMLHLLGLVLFLGSVFGHIVAGEFADFPGTLSFALARQHISDATRVLTLPGLVLAVITGIGMALAARSTRRPGWFWLHAGLASVVLLNTTLVVVPTGNRVLALVRDLPQNPVAGSIDVIRSALHVEGLFGLANVLLALAVIAVGVSRPRRSRDVAHSPIDPSGANPFV